MTAQRLALAFANHLYASSVVQSLLCAAAVSTSVVWQCTNHLDSTPLCLLSAVVLPNIGAFLAFAQYHGGSHTADAEWHAADDMVSHGTCMVVPYQIPQLNHRPYQICDALTVLCYINRICHSVSIVFILTMSVLLLLAESFRF